LNVLQDLRVDYRHGCALKMTIPRDEMEGTMDQSEKVREVALKRYDTIMRYLASDNAIYWTRSQLLLVAHAAMLGFLGNQFKDVPTDIKTYAWFKLGALFVECLSGLGLCLIWYFAIKGGRYWLDRWENILKNQLEEQAFDQINVYRNIMDRPKPRTRTVAYLTLGLFAFVWLCALALTLYLAISKCRA